MTTEVNDAAATTAAGALAEFATRVQLEGLDERVRHEAVRAFANVVGVSLGGVPLDASQRALATIRTLGGPPQARVLGTREAAPVDRVALVDGVLAHVLDYDDTHLGTILHPSAPVMAGLLPLAEWREASGEDFLAAWIVGLEVGIRLAIALGRAHYDHGWHVTGTAGGVAAAAACARLLGLDAQRTANALGIAATQANGHREQFGYMTKSLHVGVAGHAGLFAALLAEQGFDASPVSFEGRRGLLPTIAPASRPEELTAGLGEDWRLPDNCIKPYASGVVTHPAIDGGRALHDEGIAPDRIAKLELRVHPLVLELTGKTSPQTGLEGKFSVYHCAAMGLIDGIAGPRQFTDEIVVDPATVAVRERISVTAGDDVAHMTAHVRAELTDGSVRELVVDPARGTADRQLTDDELAAKFLDAATVVLSEQRARSLFAQLMDLPAVDSIAALVAATIPEETA
ncbi:MAG TPA: MmgE/PrpD family protein [Conexibacter sp.]|nr:MmgE/PrpD family protein [Conexibacter sp.]